MKYLYPIFFCLLFLPARAQVELLTELNPGTAYSDVRYLTKFQGKVFFFSANSSSSSAVWRLYKTDGTVAGTEVVYESDSINPKLDARSVFVAGNKMYFLTKKDWVWVTDGTNTGTLPVTAFYRNDTLQYLNDLVVSGNGYVYVSVANKGLGRIDTATFAVDTFYNKLAGVEIIYAFNGTAFTNTDPYNNTTETGIYDLNQSKFLLRKSVDSFSVKEYPLSPPDVCLQFLNNNEFIAVSQGFSTSPKLPVRVYKYNMQNDTKVLLREDPENTYGSAGARAAANGKVLWTMKTPGAGNAQTYILVTDGTVAGTYTFDPPGKYSYSKPGGMVAYSGKVLFNIVSNESQSNREELWITDGTLPGTIKLTQSIDSLAFVSPGGDTLNGYMYFQHEADHLWRTDGTIQGTTEVCDDSRISRFNQLINLNGRLVMSAHNQTCVGREIWVTEFNNACTISVTCPAGMNDVLEAKLNVYPNPAGNELNIELPKEEILSLHLLSVDGKVLKEEKSFGLPVYRLPVNDVAEGIYLLKLQTAKGYYTAKVVVQR